MASHPDEHPERIGLDENRGRLIASEHLGRYLWGAQLVRGRNVLDAGCGTGYGAKIIVESGADRVVGVDISKDAVAEASEFNTSERVEIDQADLRSLPYADGEFNLAMCFEVIEHVEDRDAVLDELARVLSSDGILCISTPNRRVYPPGNPHHLHEYEPREFAEVLGKRFSHVDLHRQTAWLGTAILSDAESASFGPAHSFSPRTVKMPPSSCSRSEETFTVAVASQRKLPRVHPQLALGDSFEVRWWKDQIHAAHTDAQARGREARDAEARGLITARKLLGVEEMIAHSNAQIFALDQALDERSEEADRLRRDVERLEGEREQAKSDREQAMRAHERASYIVEAMNHSVSWRLTAPLRALKRVFVR